MLRLTDELLDSREGMLVKRVEGLPIRHPAADLRFEDGTKCDVVWHLDYKQDHETGGFDVYAWVDLDDGQGDAECVEFVLSESAGHGAEEPCMSWTPWKIASWARQEVEDRLRDYPEDYLPAGHLTTSEAA